jgi:hypothetical protein
MDTLFQNFYLLLRASCKSLSASDRLWWSGAKTQLLRKAFFFSISDVVVAEIRDKEMVEEQLPKTGRYAWLMLLI